MNYSIGIVSFNKRFETYFKPLIKVIKDNSDIEVIVCVNGSLREGFDQIYRKELLNFLAEYDKVYPMIFTSFRSLSKLWNNLIINSTNDNILILNDDVKILDKNFFEDIEQNINNDLFTINESWSHFVANKTQMTELGFFDERLLGVGEEDGDMVFRYINKYGQRPKNITSQNLFNISSNENQENMKKGIGKYSLFNRSFMFNHKYSMQSNGIQGMFDYPVIQNIPDANLYPYEKFYLDNINNL
jgi:GR25 family glycosyltransferase involved in LPS biosynthesis